jgi:hypothetical protein
MHYDGQPVNPARDKKSKSFTPKLYTGAIENGINIPFPADGKYNNE